MVCIVLNEEQSKLIASATDRIELRDQNGRHLGFVSSYATEEDIRLAKEALASDDERHTFAEVRARLESLEAR